MWYVKFGGDMATVLKDYSQTQVALVKPKKMAQWLSESSAKESYKLDESLVFYIPFNII